MIATSTSLSSLVVPLGKALLKRQWKLTTAESCTGGGLAQAITCVPGSSQWFECGFITYSNRAKQQLLAVQQKTLDHYGAISYQCASEMAQGALQQSGANITMAITGIAGPTGGSHTKPVGTIWFAWGYCHTKPIITTSCHHFSGNRTAICQQAIIRALHILLSLVTYG